MAAYPKHAVVPALTLAVVPLALFELGFLGTQRLFFFRRLTGRDLDEGLWSPTARFFWRFFRLAIFWSVIAALLQLGVRAATERHHVLVVALTTSLVADAVLTFAPPALALTTSSAIEAFSTGIRIAARNWRTCWPYLLTPGVTVMAVDQV